MNNFIIETLEKNLIAFIRKEMDSRDGSHDLLHTVRVKNIAKAIMEEEGGDVEIIVIASLLHDLYDYKYSDEGSEEAVVDLLLKNKFTSEHKAMKIAKIVNLIGFSKKRDLVDCIEYDIVQDADFLDAMGSIGIARCFMYNGAKNSSMKNTINHFNEKLLKLYSRLRTKTGLVIGKNRHESLVRFMHEFKNEMKMGGIRM